MTRFLISIPARTKHVLLCRRLPRWFDTATIAAALVLGKPEEALAQTAPAIGTVITNVVIGVERRYEVVGNPVYSLAQVHNPDLAGRKFGVSAEGVASAATLVNNLPDGPNLLFYVSGRFQLRGESKRASKVPDAIKNFVPYTYDSMKGFLDNGTLGYFSNPNIGSQLLGVNADSRSVTAAEDPNGFFVVEIDLLDSASIESAKSYDTNGPVYLINNGPDVSLSFLTDAKTGSGVTTRVVGSSTPASDSAHGMAVVPSGGVHGFVETTPVNLTNPMYNVCIGGGWVPLKELKGQVITLSTTRVDGGLEVTFTEKDSTGTWVPTELKGVATVELNNALTGGWTVLRTVPKGAKGFKWEAPKPPEPEPSATFFRLRQ